MNYYKKKIDMNDINYTLELDFFESIHGCTKKINVSYYKICDICNGIGMINSTICPDCKIKILNQELNKESDIKNNNKIVNKTEIKQDSEQNFNISIDQELNKNSDNQNLNYNEDILQLDNFDLDDLQNNSSDNLSIGLLKQDIETLNEKDFNQELISDTKQELKQVSDQVINNNPSKNNKICKKCHNTGYIFLSNCPICKNGLKQAEKEVEITIKPRCDESTRYIIKNFNKGINGGKNGNLIINFKIKNNTNFKIINDYDIQFKLDIHMKDAILGKVIAIPTIYQKYYKLTIPKFTQQGTKIIIKQLGLLKNVKLKDDKSVNNYGNMIVKINVLIPVNLNDNQLKLIKQL